MPAAALTVTAFITGVLLAGVLYYYYTGNFFFRVLQINNAAYSNPCSFSTYSLHEKMVRLTYGVWQQFITGSFYPVILAALVLLLRLLFDSSFSLRKNSLAIWFFSSAGAGALLSLFAERLPAFVFYAEALYFPASTCRTSLCVFLEEAGTNKMIRLLFIAASVTILLVCVKSTGLKCTG